MREDGYVSNDGENIVAINRTQRVGRGVFLAIGLITLLTSLIFSGEAKSNSSLLEMCEEIGAIIETHDGKKQTDKDMELCINAGSQVASLILNDLKTYIEQERQMLEMADKLAKEKQEALDEWRAKKNSQQQNN